MLGTQTQEHPRGCDNGKSTFHGARQASQSAGQPVLGLKTKLIGKSLPLHYSPNSAQPECVK